MNEIPQEARPIGPRFGARHVQIILLISLCAFGAITRITLPSIIEALTDSNKSNGTFLNNTSNSDAPPYHWGNKQITLSSFDWGYIILLLIGGKLATKYGTKRLLTIAVLVSSTATVLTPLYAYYFGSAGVIICRVCQGLCTGLYYTSCYHILAQWMPIQEMSRALAMLECGYTSGYMIISVLSGYICASRAGWSVIYYLSGSMGFLWIIPWTLFACNSPGEHVTITIQEKLYIQASLASREHTKSGLILATCYLLRIFLSIIIGFISDILVNKHVLSRTISRKIFNSAGTIIPGIAVGFLGFCTADQPIKYIYILLTVAGTSVATYHGCVLNIMDISPTFCGTLRGIVEFFYTIFSLLVPLAANSIIEDEEQPGGWIILFTQISIINIFGGLFYIFYATGKVQKWSPVSKMRIYGSIGRSDEKVVTESSLSFSRPASGGVGWPYGNEDL